MTTVAAQIQELAGALVATGRRLWAAAHNNTPSAQCLYQWMRAVAPGQFVLEITASRRPALDRVGQLISITSHHEYTIRTVDGRKQCWENAQFVRILWSEVDDREIFLLGERQAV